MDTVPQYLVALDLDGTSVRYDPRLEMDPAVVDCLRKLRTKGVAWVMNSDRYTDDMVDIAGLLEPDDRPSAILSCQRFILMRDREDGYTPLSAWNKQQMLLHAELWKSISPYFSEWRSRIERTFSVVNSVINDIVFAFLVPAEQTEDLRTMLRSFIKPWPNAQLSGNHEWSFVLHTRFSKGRLLSACAEHLGIRQDMIISVGDGINDISMLNGSVTKKVGCPSNASPEVAAAVEAAGGLVAQSAAGSGTIEVIRHYLGNL